MTIIGRSEMMNNAIQIVHRLTCSKRGGKGAGMYCGGVAQCAALQKFSAFGKAP